MHEAREFRDTAGADGVYRVYRRPSGVSVAEFLAAEPAELDLDYETPNVLLNTWWAQVFWNLLASPSDPTVAQGDSLIVTCLSLGTGNLGSGPTRNDTGMVAEWKRFPVVSYNNVWADPPSLTLSFFSPSSDGNVTLTEAGLLYNQSSLTVGSYSQVMSHAVFAYVKTNQDLRIDYTIARSTLT